MAVKPPSETLLFTALIVYKSCNLGILNHPKIKYKNSIIFAKDFVASCRFSVRRRRPRTEQRRSRRRERRCRRLPESRVALRPHS